MKILFVAVFTPNSTNVSQARGLRKNGCEVIEYDYRDRFNILKNINKRDDELIITVKNKKPDLVIFSKCNNMHYRVVDEINKVSKTCLWYMDAMHNFNNELIEKLKRVNFFVCGVEGVVKESLKFNKKSFFLHQCPDELQNFHLNKEKKYNDDISFIGSIDSSKIHNNREEYVTFLNKNYKKFKHYNNIYSLEHNKKVNYSKINLKFLSD